MMLRSEASDPWHHHNIVSNIPFGKKADNADNCVDFIDGVSKKADLSTIFLCHSIDSY